MRVLHGEVEDIAVVNSDKRVYVFYKKPPQASNCWRTDRIYAFDKQLSLLCGEDVFTYGNAKILQHVLTTGNKI